METSTKFSNTEIVLLISNSIISKLFLVYPSAFSALGASASLLLATVTALLGFPFAMLLCNLCKKDVSVIFKSKIMSLLFIALFICNQGYFIRSVAENLKLSILPDSPMFFILLIFIAGVLVFSHTGLKAIIRAHSFVTPFTLSLVFFLVMWVLGKIFPRLLLWYVQRKVKKGGWSGFGPGFGGGFGNSSSVKDEKKEGEVTVSRQQEPQKKVFDKNGILNPDTKLGASSKYTLTHFRSVNQPKIMI